MGRRAIMRQKYLLIIALIIPTFALFGLTLFKSYSLKSGLRFILPVVGYDPVNPISGHYVTYRVDYGSDICSNNTNYNNEGCICLSLDENVGHFFLPNCEKENYSCDAILKGKCYYGRFEAGIEEYFIPESKAESIDRIVRKGKSKISIKVKKDGTALLEDLILVDN
jgi:uncharacterized membrane-anchored protein